MFHVKHLFDANALICVTPALVAGTCLGWVGIGVAAADRADAGYVATPMESTPTASL
jgi:hypothetical protein